MKIITKTILILAMVSTTSICLGQRTGSQSVAMMKESPAGMKVVRVIKAINQEMEVSDNFLSTNFTKDLIEKAGPDQLNAMLKSEIRSEDGSLTVYKINRPEIFEYQLTIKGEKSGWLTMVFSIDSNEPYRIKGFTLDNAEEPAEVSEPMTF